MLRLNNVCKSYNGFKVINNISIEFPSKGLYAILGESGCGKTTLFNIIAALDTPTSGNVLFGDINITKLDDKTRSSYRKNICTIIYQNNYLCPYLNGEENIEMANKIKNTEHKLNDYAEKLGVMHCLSKLPKCMSGGEQQRVSLIRSLLCNNPVILADEPTGSLDSINSHVVMDILKNESKNKLVIIVTHDMELASKYADKILHLEKGVIKEKVIAKEIKYSQNGLFDYRNISFRNLFFWSFKSFINRKNRYIPIIFCYVICITFLFLVLGGKTGVSNYLTTLIEKRFDYEYINIYTIKENHLDSIDENLLDLIQKYDGDVEVAVSFDNYISQFLKIEGLDEKEYYELKVVNMNDNKIVINDLLSKKLKLSKVIINGEIIIPYVSGNKLISERKFISINSKIDAVIEEGELYNTPKLYLSRDFINEVFGDIKMGLIANELSLEALTIREYFYEYPEFCNMPLQIVIKNKKIKTKLYDELLAIENTYPQYSLSTQTKNYNIVETGDEMLRTTFKNIIDMGQIVIIMLILFLVFIITSIISLMLYYSSKERSKEFALIRTFGGSKIDISKLILFESFYISFFVLIISIFVSYILSYMTYLNSSSILNINNLFNIFQFRFIDVVTIIIICFSVTFFSSFSSILKTYKANIFGIFKD